MLVEEAGLEFGLLSQPGFMTGLCSLFPGIVNFKGHFYQVSYGSLRAALSLGQFFSDVRGRLRDKTIGQSDCSGWGVWSQSGILDKGLCQPI